MQKETKTQNVQIKPPNIKVAEFAIVGTAPLVIHRFSQKAKAGMMAKMEAGSVSQKDNRKKREPADLEEIFNAGRYISKEGWDGFNASAIRSALISACRLVGFKMTLAKMAIFEIPDGRDAAEPEIALVRIYGKARQLEMVGRVETGQAYVTVRPIYDEWKAKIKIRFDADLFSLQDVSNLLARVGTQVGIGEGRPDSKDSAGMGWGTFRIE